jgi:hypothetical protein
MYETGTVLGATTVAGVTAAVTVLPNTGGDLLVQIGLSVAAGMLTWGILNARSLGR